jgi:hypothetical protein
VHLVTITARDNDMYAIYYAGDHVLNIRKDLFDDEYLIKNGLMKKQTDKNGLMKKQTDKNVNEEMTFDSLENDVKRAFEYLYDDMDYIEKYEFLEGLVYQEVPAEVVDAVKDTICEMRDECDELSDMDDVITKIIEICAEEMLHEYLDVNFGDIDEAAKFDDDENFRMSRRIKHQRNDKRERRDRKFNKNTKHIKFDNILDDEFDDEFEYRR